MIAVLSVRRESVTLHRIVLTKFRKKPGNTGMKMFADAQAIDWEQ